MKQAERLYMLSQAVESATDAIAISLPAGTNIYMNPSFKQLFGYPSNEVLNREGGPKETFVDPVLFKEIFKTIMSGTPWRGEVDMRSRSGRSFPVYMQANPVKDEQGEVIYIMAVINDITERKQALAELNTREAALRQQAQNLEEANAALKVLLTRRSEDRHDLEQKVLANTKDLLLPYVEKLKACTTGERQKALVDIIVSNLYQIIKPFSHQLTSKYYKLTAHEIQIAGLIREGKSTKEIAGIMRTSKRAIEFHRSNIRKKLGIKNKKANLRSHLLTNF